MPNDHKIPLPSEGFRGFVFDSSAHESPLKNELAGFSDVDPRIRTWVWCRLKAARHQASEIGLLGHRPCPLFRHAAIQETWGARFDTQAGNDPPIRIGEHMSPSWQTGDAVKLNKGT